jgi:hypothetical protein
MKWENIIKDWTGRGRRRLDSGREFYDRDWKDQITARPENFNKLFAVFQYLIQENKEINLKNITEELDQEELSEEDEEAIKYILEEGSLEGIITNKYPWTPPSGETWLKRTF